MTTQLRRTIPHLLTAAQVAINNTLADPEILALVATYGYTADKLQEGKRLHTAAVGAVAAQAAAAGAQRQATAHAHAAEQAARASYQALAQVARAVYGQTAAQRTTLGLVGPAPQGTATFLSAATTLFDNAANIGDVTAALANYGYDVARLSDERERIDVLNQAHQAQVAAKGAAQQATREQQAALFELARWLGRYRTISKIALRSKPELIEKLGLGGRVTRTPAQRGAAKKAAVTRAARQTPEEPQG